MSSQHATMKGHDTQTCRPLPALATSRKIQPCHQERLAIVYVRQSTQQQVLDNRESTARQYALVDQAVQLGWSPDQVEVIDDDQASSGATAEGRQGFHRLLAEVGLDHVGLILGIELSRLARSNKDWHQLIELCGIFRTLLADQDGLYDPTDYNDRLLLGLRGMMSEAELHVLRGRMYQAALNKACRGELVILPPIGYVKRHSGELAIDPDEQVQSVVHLIFETFDRLGTVRGVARFLHEHDIKMPIRPHAGPNRGNLEWRRPKRDAVHTVLTHPLYKGTYRYGHRQVDPRRRKPGQSGSGRVVMSPEDYHALIDDRWPAYITAERFQRNQERIRDNRVHAHSKGAPREGESLLGGLVICGRCFRRMNVNYSGQEQSLRYCCRRDVETGAGGGCQSLSGRVLDEFVSRKLLAALEPAALELSLLAAEDLGRQRQDLNKNWQQRLERARYEAERTRRQYDAVEPENRLVARELEKTWESSLRDVQRLEQQYAHFRQSHSDRLTETERQDILALSQQLPTLWNAATTTPPQKQRLVRLLVQQVVVNVQGRTDRVEVTLDWTGGFTSRHELNRPVLRYDQIADYDRLIARIEELRSTGLAYGTVAEHLNREGFHPPKQTPRFHADLVSALVRRHNQTPVNSRSRIPARLLKENEWLVIDLARELGMPKNTLHAWIRQGWVHVVRQLPGYRGRLICWADADELDRLRRLEQTNRGWWDPPLPLDLITPRAPSPG
ncbi:MAG: recombinase family protein [Gemmatimonadaceae bacterium]|nr:recombinase family protein [Gemmatimonadaceae bacterium]